MLSGLVGGASQGCHAGWGLRSGHDAQEPAGDAQADPLGLGDGGELVLLLAGDLDGVPEPRSKGLVLRLLSVELLLEFVDAGPGWGAVHGFDDILGLAVERLTRLVATLGHRGDVAVSAAEDGEGGGDTLRDRGHGGTFRRGRSRDHAHDCTRLDGNCPRKTPSERWF